MPKKSDTRATVRKMQRATFNKNEKAAAARLGAPKGLIQHARHHGEGAQTMEVAYVQNKNPKTEKRFD